MFTEDYLYVCKALENHHLLCNTDRKEQFKKLCEAHQKKVSNYASLIDDLTAITTFYLLWN